MSIEKLQNLLERKIIRGIETYLPLGGTRFQIKNEKGVELFTEINGGKTILKILGYKRSTVQDHPIKIVMGVNVISPDYGLLVNGTHAAILDVKSPRENLDRHHEQILSYCEHYKSPIGVLFNGKSVRLYVSTALIPGLDQRHRTEFDNKPVFAADITPMHNGKVPEERQDDIKRMADILFMLSKDSFGNDAIAHARNLISTRIKEIDQAKEIEGRRQNIINRFSLIKSNPSNQVLSAIKRADTKLNSIKSSDLPLKELWKEA